MLEGRERGKVRGEERREVEESNERRKRSYVWREGRMEEEEMEEGGGREGGRERLR